MAPLWTPKLALLAFSLHCSPAPVTSFIPVARPTPSRSQSPLVVLHSSTQRRKPSKVTDDAGPTPNFEEAEIEEVDNDDIPELREFQLASDMPDGPIPHQPWRRGETNGCEDPITADWRIEAEDIIKAAVTLAGGKVIDVTWFLTSLVVTLDPDLSGAQNPFKDSGPEIIVKTPTGPLWYDPNDPKPEDIYTDEEDIVYQRETEEEAEERKEKKRNMWAKPDEDDPEGEPHIPEGLDDTEDVGLFMNEESRDDAAGQWTQERAEEYEQEPKSVNRGNPPRIFDTAALSTVADAILQALEDVDDRLEILSRHTLALTCPSGHPALLETQKQFDSFRGRTVHVATQDPWQSNRVLKGKLLDRNSMDIYINKQGRMVTIPLNFVKSVRVELTEEEVAEYCREVSQDGEVAEVSEEEVGEVAEVSEEEVGELE